VTDRLALAIAELTEALREELRAEAASDSAAPDRLYSIPEAAERMGGIGRSLLYDIIGRGELRVIHAGRRVLVPASSIAAYVAERAA
jgi:excisionase family DNA binding protein